MYLSNWLLVWVHCSLVKRCAVRLRIVSSNLPACEGKLLSTTSAHQISNHIRNLAAECIESYWTTRRFWQALLNVIPHKTERIDISKSFWFGFSRNSFPFLVLRLIRWKPVFSRLRMQVVLWNRLPKCGRCVVILRRGVTPLPFKSKSSTSQPPRPRSYLRCRLEDTGNPDVWPRGSVYSAPVESGMMPAIRTLSWGCLRQGMIWSQN